MLIEACNPMHMRCPNWGVRYPSKGTGCPDGACYSNATPASATSLGIKVPAAGPQRVVFDFHNTGTNLQLLLPMTVTIGCGDSSCLEAPPVLAIPSKVPGDLITDLQTAGLVGDPLYELNFRNSSLWDGYDWTFTTTIDVAADRLDRLAANGGSHVLVFDGVKMGANVVLNGKTIGTTTDQFLRYEFPLEAGALTAGANTLEVVFNRSISCDGRWMACTGGWDWAPYTATRQDGIATFSKGTTLSGSISTIFIVLSCGFVRIHMCGALHSPVCA